MEIGQIEKEIYYDGIKFMRYVLEYPYGEDIGDFAKRMTEGYRDYLEGAYLSARCRAYDEDPERRKRYRHSVIEVYQKVRSYQKDRLYSCLFHVYENREVFEFGFTYDGEKRIMMHLGDLYPKRRTKRKNLFFYDGNTVWIFDKSGKTIEKTKQNLKK